MGQQLSFHIALILIQTRSSEVAESTELPPVTVDSGHTHHRPPTKLSVLSAPSWGPDCYMMLVEKSGCRHI